MEWDMVMGIDKIPNTIISTLSGEEVVERTGVGGGVRGGDGNEH